MAVSATKVQIILDLTMAFLNPGVNGNTNFESAPKCKLGHVLRDIVWRVLFLRRTLAPHQQDGCQGRVSAGGCGMGRLHEVRVRLLGFCRGRQASGVWVAEQSRVLLPSCMSD